MLVQRVLPKIAPYAIATATLLGISTTKLNAADKFEKKEDKKEITVSNNEKEERSIPWLDICTIGSILAFLGVIRFANYLEKKEKEEEKANQIKTEEKTEKE